MGIWRLVFRLIVGVLFVGHAAQKLFGWFDGPGLRDAGEGFEGMGLRPGRPTRYASVAEAGGGAMLAAGFETPAAAAMLSGTMMTAIQRAHLARGLWNTRAGSSTRSS